MEPVESNGSVRLVPVDPFDGHEVVTVEINNVPHWPARQLGACLGYEDEGKRLPTLIAREWSDEFTDADRVLVDGEQLAQLKAARPDLVAPNTPSLLLLTESGVYLASILTKKPAGRALRRWLVDVALPAWRSGHGPGSTPAAASQLAAAVWNDLNRAGLLDEPAVGAAAERLMSGDQVHELPAVLAEVVAAALNLVQHKPQTIAVARAPGTVIDDDTWADTAVLHVRQPWPRPFAALDLRWHWRRGAFPSRNVCMERWGWTERPARNLHEVMRAEHDAYVAAWGGQPTVITMPEQRKRPRSAVAWGHLKPAPATTAITTRGGVR